MDKDKPDIEKPAATGAKAPEPTSEPKPIKIRIPKFKNWAEKEKFHMKHRHEL